MELNSTRTAISSNECERGQGMKDVCEEVMKRDRDGVAEAVH